MLKYLDELENELPTGVESYLNAGRILHGFVERNCQPNFSFKKKSLIKRNTKEDKNFIVAIECAIDGDGSQLGLHFFNETNSTLRIAYCVFRIYAIRNT
jgi:hypothetical protein